MRDPISLVALVILIVTLVVGTLITSNTGRSFELRRQASEISCNSLSEGSCTGTPGCHLSDVSASCAGKSASDCSVTSGCNAQYTTQFVSCGGTPPCNAAARCTAQNTYANCTMADCTSHRSGCILHAATSGSCTGSSPVCSGRSQTDCNSLHQTMGCDWSGGSSAFCTEQYVSGQTCVGPGNTVSTFSGCSGSYVSGKRCEGVPYTPTPIPQHSPTPPPAGGSPTPTVSVTLAIVHDINKTDCEQKYSGCSLDGNICIPDKQINAGYYCCKAGTGNGRSFNHFQQESCDAPVATPTTPALIQTTDAEACTRDWNGCFFNGSCVPSGQENAHNCCINGLYTGHSCSAPIPTATPTPPSVPLVPTPTITPRPTPTLRPRATNTPTSLPGIPSCTLLVVQECQARGQSCIADTIGGHCSTTPRTSIATITLNPSPVPNSQSSNQCRWGKLFASCQDYGYSERSGSCGVLGCPGGGTCCGGARLSSVNVTPPQTTCNAGSTRCSETINLFDQTKTIASLSTCQSDGVTFSAPTPCAAGNVCNSARTQCVASIVSTGPPPKPKCAERDNSCQGNQEYTCLGGEWLPNVDSSNCLRGTTISPTPTPSSCAGDGKHCVNGYVYYNQRSDSWRSSPLPGGCSADPKHNYMGFAACGQSVAASLLSTYVDPSYTVPEVFAQNTPWATCNGIPLSTVKNILESHGFKTTQIYVSEDNLWKYVQAGNPVLVDVTWEVVVNGKTIVNKHHTLATRVDKAGKVHYNDSYFGPDVVLSDLNLSNFKVVATATAQPPTGP